jgi:hypothetical protein
LSCFDSRNQFRWIEDGDGGLDEIADVPGRDRVHGGQPSRLLEHRILEIRDLAAERLFEYGAVDGGNLEQVEESLKRAARLLRRKGLAEKIVNGGDRCCAEQALDSRFLNKREDLSGRVRKGLAVKQDIQNDIGIDQNPQEYFSRRCFL